jgi:phosphate transport system substrate-binding protein
VKTLEWTVRQAGITASIVLGMALPLGLASAESPQVEELVIVGSGNLARILELMKRDFEREHPQIHIVIHDRSSSAGPPALLSGRAQIASMSRPMSPDELHAFQSKLGRQPARISIAIDALAVFVNEGNPLRQITLMQLDEVFSSTRNCGGNTAITHWRQLGLAGDWGARSIGVYGHAPSAGTYAFFRMHALCGGHFREDVRQQPGGRSIALSLAETRYGIGYTARADKRRGIRALAIAAEEGDVYGTIDPSDVYAGAYPLTRDLYLYHLQHRSADSDASTKDEPTTLERFLRFGLSPDGQRAVEKAGFLKLPTKRIEEERATLD